MTQLHLGDCLQVLKAIEANTIHAIVCDPPYGLSFMGKGWDYDVPAIDIWRECLRVLKPGGHLLAFAGTRTQHRMAVNIEDAGFEIRDMIAWVYGSGFPKSLDVSKAIDKMDASEEQERRRLRFTAWVRSTGVTSRQIDDATGTNMGGHYTTAASQPAIMTREHLEQCRHLFRDVPGWVEREADQRTVDSENFNRRVVVSTEVRYNEASGIVSAARDERTLIERKITEAHTPEAQAWAGWGTALKPALEPITVARKPLDGTVAANVLQHGVGGINVDGCRVVTEGGTTRSEQAAYAESGWRTGREMLPLNTGRWPANLIRDGSPEVLEAFGGTSTGSTAPELELGQAGTADGFGKNTPARFFYCAKASKRERGQGNHHPTVKPTDLMRYLCRLVTPPGGIVLDPFMGSGSTGKAALLERFRFVGIERDPDYFTIAQARITAVEAK